MMISKKFWLVVVLSFASAMAQTNATFPDDPILRYRPPFAQSLPVQILLTGVALTLALVLLLHLLFTAPYHFPIARTNYILQLTGVTALIISLIATLYVIFSATVQQSQHWPYMLSYLAVEMPAAKFWDKPIDPLVAYQTPWSTAESATWVVMNATTSAIVQITHIHFLTLLFPSHLEARLIFGLLGPLAVISAVMQLLPVIRGPSVSTIAEDTRNVCNAALSLLFTSSLVIWGCFINRRQAWRTDGGTAAFGAGAIVLALISTSLNFVYIPQQDQYAWMPKLMWVVTLWQSFFGWWWWVGAGMGVREAEELLFRENKRQQKRMVRAQRRKEHRDKARSVWKGVTGAFKPSSASRSGSGVDDDDDEHDLSRSPSRDVAATGVSAAVYPWMMFPVHLVQRWYARLRHAHLAAAHVQAAEREERLQQVYHQRDERRRWGLRNFGMRETETERGRQEEVEMDVWIPPKRVEDDGEGEGDEDEWKDVPMAQDPLSDTRLRYRGGSGLQTDDPASGSSLWWWGPLRRWRLQDSTTYR